MDRRGLPDGLVTRMNTTEPEWVFAYGSNMDLDDLRGWLADQGQSANGIQRVEQAALPDHRLVWNYHSVSRQGGAANVEPCAGRDLPGLALLVDAATLQAIDRKEGNPRYYSRGRSPLTLRLQGGQEVSAWVYVAVPERCSDTPVPPRRAYLGLLLKAARKYALPAWYLAELEGTMTAD